MAKFSRIQVFQTMEQTKLVPLHYNDDIEVIKNVLAACYRGGARVFEFTNRGDFAHEIFGQLNKFCLSECPDMILGVGSVTDAGTASLYMQLGANFIVTPALREDVALVCNRRKVMYAPGCGSLTEIGRAEELGCELIKLFPGGVYGPKMIKSIKAPQPWTCIMPTGGVTPERANLEEWFAAGATCVGMGSRLITKEFVKNQDYVSIENQVRSTLSVIKDL